MKVTKRHMKILSRVMLGAACIGLMTVVCAQAQTASTDFKKGQFWVGKYSCNTQTPDTNFMFAVKDVQNGAATLHALYRPSNKTLIHSLTSAAPSSTSPKARKLAAGEWIFPSGGWSAVSFSGTFSNSNETFSGTNNCGGAFTTTLREPTLTELDAFTRDTLYAAMHLNDAEKITAYIDARTMMIDRLEAWKFSRETNPALVAVRKHNPIKPDYSSRMKHLRKTKKYDLTITDIKVVDDDFAAEVTTHYAKLQRSTPSAVSNNATTFKKGQFWVGKYSCNSQTPDTNFMFAVNNMKAGSAEVYFLHDLPRRHDPLIFSLRSHNSYATKTSIQLTAGDWIFPTTNWNPVNFSGTFSNSNKTFSGTTTCNGAFTTTLRDPSPEELTFPNREALNAAMHLADVTKLVDFLAARKDLDKKIADWKYKIKTHDTLKTVRNHDPIKPDYISQMKALRAEKKYGLTVTDVSDVHYAFVAEVNKRHTKLTKALVAKDEKKPMILLGELHMSEDITISQLRAVLEKNGAKLTDTSRTLSSQTLDFDLQSIIPGTNATARAVFVNTPSGYLLASLTYNMLEALAGEFRRLYTSKYQNVSYYDKDMGGAWTYLRDNGKSLTYSISTTQYYVTTRTFAYANAKYYKQYLDHLKHKLENTF